MLISQVITTLDIIRKYPGLDLDGLADKIYKLYGDIPMVRFMLSETNGPGLLQDRIDCLSCVEERQGRYYYNPRATRYSDSVLINDFVRFYLETEEAKRQQGN